MVEHVCVVCNVWVFCDVHDFFFQYRVLSTVSHIFISTFLQPFILISFFSSFLVWIYDKWRWTIRLSIFFFLLPLLDLYCLSYICVGQLFIYIYEFWIMNYEFWFGQSEIIILNSSITFRSIYDFFLCQPLICMSTSIGALVRKILCICA